MAREIDLEKGDLQLELDTIEPHDFQDTSTSTTPRQPDAALTKDSEGKVPYSNSEETIDDPPRLRSDSKSSRSSHDSLRTLSDAGVDHQTSKRPTISRVQSSLGSVRREIQRVPRGKRRGLLARFTIIAEVTNPYDYPRRTKWFLTFVIAVAGAAAPMASSIVLPALVDIEKDLNSTATVANLSVALYMLSMSIFPLWWSSFSETLGRRTIYLTSFALYVVFSIVGAVSTDVGMFIAMRMLSGGAAASVQAVGAGSVSDIWEVKERGRAMGIFYLGPLCGPLLSPIIGGLLSEELGWRSVQWFLAIMGVVILLLVLFAFPETLKERKSVAAAAEVEAVEKTTGVDATMDVEKTTGVDATVDVEKTTGVDATVDVEKTGAVRPALMRTTTTQSVHIKTRKYLAALRRMFLDPLRIILYLQFPAVAVCVGYASILFCSLYMLNISIQQTFSAPPYGYSNIVVGLLYLPNSVGYFLTSLFGGKWVDNIMAREADRAGRRDARGKLQFRPEDRMRENAWLGAMLYPAALIVYGWTSEYGVNLAAPMVANFFFGIGSMLIFAMATTMLTEFMPRKASNGVALNNFVRNIFSCAGSAATEPIIRAIGNGPLFSGLGVISVIAGSLSIWAMRRYGDHWRITMDRNIERVQGR